MSLIDRLHAACLVAACRVPSTIQPRTCGLWEIRRFTAEEIAHPVARAFLTEEVGWSSYTALARTTMATLDRELGEIVMEDSQRELRRHLPILLAAQGRVLVSGLGLGCVVRGLLCKTEVEHIDVVEIDPTIVDLVGREFTDDDRVTLYIGDAESIEWPPGTRWDFAWHDVWSESESLDVVHARMLVRYRDMVRAQGCWQFPRALKRAWPGPLLGAPRRRAA